MGKASSPPACETCCQYNSQKAAEAKIKDSSVTTSKLTTNSVTTEKIVNGTIQEEDLSEDLQVKLDKTKRIFVVSSMPTGDTITDINNQTITAQLGDIIVLVKGINGSNG